MKKIRGWIRDGGINFVLEIVICEKLFGTFLYIKQKAQAHYTQFNEGEKEKNNFSSSHLSNCVAISA